VLNAHKSGPRPMASLADRIGGQTSANALSRHGHDFRWCPLSGV